MAKQIDVIQQFTQLRSALQRERANLLNRLQQIDAALADGAGAKAPGSRPAVTGGATPRTGNDLNMREAIALATSKQPLKVSQIAAAVQALGFKFTSANPTNSVGAFLYGPGGKQHFKKVGRKFSPIEAASTAPSAKGKAAKPVKAKRKMSAEGRRNIAAAVARRWAKVRAAKKA